MEISEQEVVSSLSSLRRCGEAVELPREYTEYAAFVDLLRDTGALDWLQTVVLDRRSGAFELVDVVLLFSAFFSASTPSTAIGEFCEDSREYGHELAAIGGRNRWMTQSAVSRALAAVSLDDAMRTSRKLLAAVSDVVQRFELCREAGYRDGTGAPLTVLHWDATVEAVRQRALPESDDLPKGTRLSDSLARPGYPGRKRGEVVFSRSIVSDATSGVWIHVDLCAGNGSPGDQLAQAVEASLAFASHGPEWPCVMVCDGVSGGVPQARAVLQAGMHILTRGSEYDRLKTPAAKALIANSGWLPVVDSRSGPRREAIDLGTRTIAGTKVRVIASRFPVPLGRRNGAGHKISGWQYELFYSDLPVSGWAANDLVTLYYGRTAIENRFMAEDREFNLSRVFSYEEPGQLLACSVGMAIWGLRLATGLATVPNEAPVRPMRPRPPRPEPARDHNEGALEVDEQALLETVVSAESVDVHVPPSYLTEWCARRPGWTPQGRMLQCPANVLLSPTYREVNGATRLRFRAPASTCGTCENIDACTAKPNDAFRKEVSFIVHRRGTMNESIPLSTEPVDRYEILDVQPAEPPAWPDAPILVASVLRKRAKTLARACNVSVIACVLDPPVVTNDEHLALDQESKQRRRHCIRRRVEANARHETQSASVLLRASKDAACAYRELKVRSRSA